MPSHGTQPTPPSVNAILSSGKRTGTPVSSVLIAFTIEANVCEAACAMKAVSNPCKLNGNTGLMAVTAWRTTGRPHSWAASYTGS